MNNSVAIYARVSLDSQSVEMQMREMNRYCEARGLKIFNEYVDHGISGAKTKRPALEEMLKDCRRRKFKYVLVWRLDRLGRNTQHLISLMNELESLQIAFISLHEGFDFSTPSGRVMATMLAALATFERDLIRERVKAGLENAKAKGKRLGRPPICKGYEIKRLRLSGKSYREIASLLQVSIGHISTELKKNN